MTDLLRIKLVSAVRNDSCETSIKLHLPRLKLVREVRDDRVNTSLS